MMRRTRGTSETTEDVQREVGPGDNSKKSGFADDALLSVVERVERLEEEKKALGDDIKEVYEEAKSTGFDTGIIRKIISLRRMDAADRQEQSAMIELYMEAIARAQKVATEQSVKEGA